MKINLSVSMNFGGQYKKINQRSSHGKKDGKPKNLLHLFARIPINNEILMSKFATLADIAQMISVLVEWPFRLKVTRLPVAACAVVYTKLPIVRGLDK